MKEESNNEKQPPVEILSALDCAYIYPEDEGLAEAPVHALLYLNGCKDALEKAKEIIYSRTLYRTSYGRPIIVERIVEGNDGEARWFDITLDNYIPQIYDELSSIDGVERILYLFYNPYLVHFCTNDSEGVMWKRRDIFGIPSNLEFEEVDYYLAEFEMARFDPERES